MPEPYQNICSRGNFLFSMQKVDIWRRERVKSVNYKCEVCVLMIPGNLKTNRAAAWLTVVIKER